MPAPTRYASSTKTAAKHLDRVRGIIAAWPETDERLSHGSPTWWGGRKTFATWHENHHGDGRIGLWIKSDPETQQDLVEAYLWIRQHMSDAQKAADAQATEQR